MLKRHCQHTRRGASPWQTSSLASRPQRTKSVVLALMSTAVVVGGGIAGLLSAHALCQRGFQVTLLDADRFDAAEVPTPGIASLLEVRRLTGGSGAASPTSHVVAKSNLCMLAVRPASQTCSWCFVALWHPACRHQQKGIALSRPMKHCTVQTHQAHSTAGPLGVSHCQLLSAAFASALTGGEAARGHPSVQPPARPGYGRPGGHENAAAWVSRRGGCCATRVLRLQS